MKTIDPNRASTESLGNVKKIKLKLKNPAGFTGFTLKPQNKPYTGSHNTIQHGSEPMETLKHVDSIDAI